MMLKRKLISTEIWEPRGLEAYLSEMEAEGYRLVRATGWFLYFEQAAPRAMRYRAEYIRHPSEEQLLFYADCGWEHVAETNREIQIFRAPADTDIPDLHTDAEVETAMYRHVNRSAWWNLVSNILLVPVVLGWLLWCCQSGAIESIDSWYLAILGVLVVCVMTGAIVRYLSTRRYLSMLKRGTKVPDGSRRYRMGVYAQYGNIAFLCLYYFFLMIPVASSLIALFALL